MKSTIKKIFRTPISRTLAIVFILANLLPLATFGVAEAAYGQVSTRSIDMSNSVAGAASTSYDVTFTTATAGAIEGLVIDFCDNDPIIGDACTYTSGQSTVTSSATTSAVTGPSNGTFTVYSNASPLIVLVDSTASTSVVSGTVVNFTLSGITNPNYSACTGGTVPNCTFYARVFTYTTPAGAEANTGGATIGTPTDAGGIALSTNAQITITSKVQEQLSFCVYTSAACTTGGAAVALGNTNGVLSSSGPYVDKNTKYDISTNAAHGAIVRMEGGTLTSGSSTITAIGSTATASSAGSAQFGMCNYESSGSNLTMSAYATYYSGGTCQAQTTQTAGTGSTGGAGSATFGFNTTNTLSTYGDPISADAAGGVSTGTIAFIANIPTTQTAGIYTTTLTFIATGTY